MKGSSDYSVETMTPSSRWGFFIAVCAVAALIALPMWGDATKMRLLVEFFYYLALAQAWNLLAGYTGLVSVGQQAFVGLGSYAFLSATVFFGVPPLVAFPIAGLVAAIIAVPSAFLMFRLQGAYFAIGTWALAEVFRLFFTQVKIFGAGTGMSLPIAIIREISADRGTRDIIVYYIALGIGLGSILFMFLWLRSRAGLALAAIRDSATAAASVGINQQRIKLIVYVISAAVAGLVGSLIILQKLRITPGAAFSVHDWSATIIFIVVIGGIGSIEGPIIGAIIYFVLRSLLADYGSWYLVILGLVAVIVMIKAPSGLWGYISERFDIHIFPVRRRVQLLGNDADSQNTETRAHG
jgi:branched-chain amino acid transport system permease protein